MSALDRDCIGWRPETGTNAAMGQGLDDRVLFAHRLADVAGAVIRPLFRRRIEVLGKTASHRAGFDPVTEADRGAEAAMRELIRKTYPDDAILGEEFGEQPGSSGYRWLLDPIDGTRAFVAGQHMWGTLIALERDHAPVLGMLDQPILRERFVGSAEKTELRNPEGTTSLRVRACPALSDATISTTHPLVHFDDQERARFSRVERHARLSRYGGDCYAYGLVAMGFIDLVVEAGLCPWDTGAIIPIVEGAGGIVTDWAGNPLRDAGDIVAAGDARVHAEALDLLRR